MLIIKKLKFFALIKIFKKTKTNFFLGVFFKTTNIQFKFYFNILSISKHIILMSSPVIISIPAHPSAPILL